MESFICSIDTKEFKQKPSPAVIEYVSAKGYEINEVSAINIRIARTLQMETTLTELASAIARGKTFTVGYFNGKRREDNFISAQLIGIDLDNGLCSFHSKPHILYQTFSHTEAKPKYRAIWLLSEPVTELKQYRAYVAGFLKLYPLADKACSDAARLFYGTDKEVKVSEHETLDVGTLEAIYPQVQKELNIGSGSARQQLLELYKTDREGYEKLVCLTRAQERRIRKAKVGGRYSELWASTAAMVMSGLCPRDMLAEAIKLAKTNAVFSPENWDKNIEEVCQSAFKWACEKLQ